MSDWLVYTQLESLGGVDESASATAAVSSSTTLSNASSLRPLTRNRKSNERLQRLRRVTVVIESDAHVRALVSLAAATYLILLMLYCRLLQMHCCEKSISLLYSRAQRPCSIERVASSNAI